MMSCHSNIGLKSLRRMSIIVVQNIETKMNIKIPAEEHRDLLGREVKVDDYVGFCHHNSMYVGQVIKITPKQVRVIPLLTQYRQTDGFLKYTNQCVLVGGPELTYMILKHG